MHAGDVYEACWALDNILIINAAHRQIVLEDDLDPVDTGNWLFFPGATVKVCLILFGILLLLIYVVITICQSKYGAISVCTIWSSFSL